MANEDQIKAAQDALVNAHNAGDEVSAQRIADYLVSLQDQSQEESQPQPVSENKDRFINDVAGGAIGGIGGAALGRGMQSAIGEAFPSLSATKGGMSKPTIDGMQRYLNSQVAMQGVKGTVPLDKFAAAMNLPQDFTSSHIQDALKELKGQPAQRIATTTPTGGKIYQHIPASKPAVNLAGLAEEAAPAAKSGLSALADKVKGAISSPNQTVGKALHGLTNPWLLKTVGNALSGASAGYQGVDAAQRLADPNQGWVRGAVSGLGALGSAAAMTRIPAALPIGVAAGVAAPWINEKLDAWAAEHPEAAKRLHLAEGGGITPVMHTAKKPDLMHVSIKAANMVKPKK